MQFILSHDQFILVTLLIQLGVVAAISTILVRFDTFKRMLFNEELGWKRKIYLMALVGFIFAVGVTARLLLNYKAADLTIASTLLVGILGGPFAGAGVGILVGVPALFLGEYLAPPFAIVCGLVGGLVFLKEPSLEKRMDFSPFSVMKLPVYIKAMIKEKTVPVQLLIFVSGTLFSIVGMEAAKYSKGALFSLYSSNWVIAACIVAGTLASVGIPLKIWNNTRVELLLLEKEKKLAEARLDALKSKVKPHFLFNTLNTIFSSIRGDPEKARSVVLRLSEVLRSVLQSESEYCKLSEEINLVESYLSIEEARFGKSKVFFEKDVEEGTLSLYIPSMILQPIVENSIKHGIAKKLGAGEIKFSAKRNGGFLELSVHDNGQGIPKTRLADIKQKGIGLSSVDERLRVLYNNNFEFDIDSSEGKGTSVRIKIPLIFETMERIG